MDIYQNKTYGVFPQWPKLFTILREIPRTHKDERFKDKEILEDNDGQSSFFTFSSSSFHCSRALRTVPFTSGWLSDSYAIVMKPFHWTLINIKRLWGVSISLTKLYYKHMTTAPTSPLSQATMSP